MRAGWYKSGKSAAHYVKGPADGPAVCGAWPNNGRWSSGVGLRRGCRRCERALQPRPSVSILAALVAFFRGR